VALISAPLGLLVAVETIPDIFRTLGNVALELRLCCEERRTRGAMVYPRDHLPLRDMATFHEVDRSEDTLDLRAHGDLLERTHGAHGLDHVRNVVAPGNDDLDDHRPVSVLLLRISRSSLGDHDHCGENGQGNHARSQARPESQDVAPAPP